MCLTSKWKFPKKARKDIVCYKILECSSKLENSSVYYTPYLSISVIVPGSLKAEGNRFRIKHAKEVGEGYIHAYTSLICAAYVSKHYFNDTQTIVVECVIPKGTKYHLSIKGTEICARKMIFGKEIPSYKLYRYDTRR